MSKMCPYERTLGEVYYCTSECPIDKCEVLQDIVPRLQDEVDELRAELTLKEAEEEFARN